LRGYVLSREYFPSSLSCNDANTMYLVLSNYSLFY